MTAIVSPVKQYTPAQARNVIILLVFSVALMMTGLGIIMPVFARRLAEMGAGVGALGVMTMSYALVQFILSPFAGGLADRYGRRPFVLIALLAFAVMNIAYMWVDSVAGFIAVRAIGSAFMAGLFPAAMGIVADITPEQLRAKWIGFVMGGYGAGIIFGPVIGGILYDGYGFAAPFATSAFLAAIAFVAALILVPETRPRSVRKAVRARSVDEKKPSFRQTLPRPLPLFGLLLLIDFVGTFAFNYIEPQMIFYVYDDLAWTTVQFGLVVGLFGLAMVFGQTMLGNLSDKRGRQPVIVVGMLLNSILYASMAFLTSFPIILVASAIAGLGAALQGPAISAFYLDITTEEHRSRVLGIKESALSLGGVLGPLVVVLASRHWLPTQIFFSAFVLVLLTTGLAMLILRDPQTVAPPERLAQPDGNAAGWQVSRKRSLVAQSGLRGLAMRALCSKRAAGQIRSQVSPG